MYKVLILFLLTFPIYFLVTKHSLFYSTFLVYVIVSLSFVWFTIILWAISDIWPRKKFPDWNQPFTIVIPIKNEDPRKFKQVVESVLRSDGKKQILIGSDGSSEENFNAYLQILKDLNLKNEDISIYKFKSLGKRIVQCKLHRIAKYNIIVNLDSDIIVWKKTFMRLLAPFLDKKVGITNARVDIVFARVFLDRFYNALYLSANQIGRKSTGRFGLMPCASGELLAYRKNVLNNNLSEYENAKFLWEIPITFGEDRLLTNIFLKNNYDSVYCEDSYCWTWGKSNFLDYIKQQLRWRRSWIRESVRCLSFSWRRPLLFINVILNLILPIAFSLLLSSIFIRIITYSDTISLLALPLMIIVTTLIRDFALLFEESNLIVNLIIFALFNLIFITPLWLYALITVDYTKWGTR